MIRIVLHNDELADATSLGAEAHIKLIFPRVAATPERREYSPRLRRRARQTGPRCRVARCPSGAIDAASVHTSPLAGRAVRKRSRRWLTGVGSAHVRARPSGGANCTSKTVSAGDI
ncbi:hypothetical protein [Salipiger sp.]|uniref:hypothetical protein n=1 Tax=Salipiger sp. TaxID=2078585 RepID=UPI003A976A71